MNIAKVTLSPRCLMHFENLEGDLEVEHDAPGSGSYVFDTSFMWCPKGNNSPEDDIENYCTASWAIIVQDKEVRNGPEVQDSGR